MGATLDLVDYDKSREPIQNRLGSAFQAQQGNVVFEVEVVLGQDCRMAIHVLPD